MELDSSLEHIFSHFAFIFSRTMLFPLSVQVFFFKDIAIFTENSWAAILESFA